jgi:hypothetical protein
VGSGICQPRIWECGTLWVSLVVAKICVRKWGWALEYASLVFGIKGCVVARQDGFWSGVVLWDTPSSVFD